MTVQIRPEDIEVVHVRGSGPGGQNRNKRWTGVRITHLPTGIVVMATERRSQLQNLGAAMERLEERLTALFTVKKKRFKTRPGRGAVEKRIESKRRHSLKKMDRRSSGD